MSFTLTHYKDGVPREIKMSIWDAFKGAPTPTPKTKPLNLTSPVGRQSSSTTSSLEPCKELANNLVQCSCCHKVHLHNRPEEKKEENSKREHEKEQTGAKDKNNNSSDRAKDDAKGDKGDRSYSTREEETYSEDDDKKIIELKQQQKNWKEILEAIGKKSQSQIKEHWKKINPDTQGKTEDKDNANSKSGGKREAPKKEEAEKKKAIVQGKKKQKQKQGEGSEKSKSSNEPASHKDPSDDNPEAAELKNWSNRYDRQKWIAAASRHFDLTGHRITPDVARKLAESK